MQYIFEELIEKSAFNIPDGFVCQKVYFNLQNLQTELVIFPSKFNQLFRKICGR